MKRLFLFIACFIFGMQMVDAIPRKALKNTQICFNDAPRTFGTTHFILGYKEPKPLKKKYKKQKVHPSANSFSGSSFIDKNRTSQAFFTTIHDLSPILLEIMTQAKKCLYIAAFTLTDSRIVNYLTEAYQNGLDICVITDGGNIRQAHSKVNALVKCNIPVWYYKPSLNPQYKKNGLSDPFMHHKIIIGDDFVVTGSANFTKAGQKTNIENINILWDKQTVDEHRSEFERLKKFCVQCTPQINE